MHAYLTQTNLLKMARDMGIQVMAYNSLSQPYSNSNDDADINTMNLPMLQRMADHYEKSVAQILYRWTI